MQVSLKLGSSYLWKSLLAGRNLVDKGYIWRIGDRQRALVWKSKWVPKGHTHMVESVPLTGHDNQQVCDFINGEQRVWDDIKLQQMLNSGDV